MTQTFLEIEGMLCPMREAHIVDTTRKAAPGTEKLAASRGKKKASFLTEEAADAKKRKTAVEETSCACPGVESVPYEKKGLFI